MPTPKHMFILSFSAVLQTGCLAADPEVSLDDGEASIPLEIERNGVTFELLEPLHDGDVDSDAPTRARPNVIAPEEPDEVRPLTDRSREELAHLLRPVIAQDGYAYVGSEPNWAAADAILGGTGRAESRDYVPRPDGGRPEVEPVDEPSFRNVIDADGRTLVTDTTQAPFNAITQIKMYVDGVPMGQCSGSYIGPWTFITSGHCLVYSDSLRANRIEFSPARDGADLPYGHHDCRLDDADPGNNLFWIVPLGYYYGQAPELDYAVIDTYPCHAAPAWFAGYEKNPGPGTFSHYGYPGSQCPGAPWGGDFMCGMTAPANINEWRIETEHIDAMPGQSGGPWWQTFAGAIDRPVGVLWGYREYYDFWQCGFAPCRRNFARKIDDAFDIFIIDFSWDY